MEPEQDVLISTRSDETQQQAQSVGHIVSNRKKMCIVCLFLCVTLLLCFTTPEQNDNSSNRFLLSNEEFMNDSVENNSPKVVYNLEYEFLNNISQTEYNGDWNELQYNKTLIGTTTGVAQLFFYKARNQLYIVNSNTTNYMKGVFYLKEGKYIDHYLRGIFNVTFPQNFTDVLKEVMQENSTQKELVISNANTTLDLYECDYLIKKTKYKFNETNITLTLKKSEKILRDSFKEMLISSFSIAQLSIKGNFSVDITTEVKTGKELESKISNYILILTLISFSEIYFIFKLLVSVNENSQVGLNLDLITITISIMYKSFICTAHFYLSLTTINDDLSYEYGIPSLLYFFSFSVFELRLLFFVWKSRYNDLLANNQTLFRKKLFLFYFLFYILLFISLISIKTIFSHYIYALLFFSCTWVFQIIHSIRTGTKPPISKSYIIVMTFNKLYLPIYLKAYEYNIFEYKPAYAKVAFLCSIVILEMMILLLQKTFGAKVIVPKCLKTVPYNYYKEDVKIEEHISSNPDCVICLDSLKETFDEELYTVKNKESKSNSRNVLMLGMLIERINQYLLSLSSQNPRKPYMVTPCDHVFHSVCLEQWMEVKNECPYCKRQIPPLE